MNYAGQERIIGIKALTGFRYKAFISYSHADEREGDWLHRALEKYVVPKNLVGKVTQTGPIPSSLTPIFRDKNDLPAAGNLNETIIAALKDSQFLIVLASPNAVKSKWVKQEIAQFKAFHGPSRVLSIIIDGEPHASDNEQLDNSLECFPETLRFNEDENGVKIAAEPLAADARTRGEGLIHSFGNDGRKPAITKLAAGLLGVPLDDLVQREAKRSAQRARMWSGVWGTVAGVLGLMVVFAFSQWNEAEMQRNEARASRDRAEFLVEHMITKVAPEIGSKIGKLDTLDTVTKGALEYYASQDERELEPDALGRKARTLHGSGEVYRKKNELDLALEAYKQAAKTTEELLQLDSKNPDRIFEHSQSVYYVGHIAFLRNDLSLAEASFLSYHDLSHKLIEIDPTKKNWQLETAYAATNLGAVQFNQGKYELALKMFEESTKTKTSLFDLNHRQTKELITHGRSLSWEAFSHMALGNYPTALNKLNDEMALYSEITDENYEALYFMSIAARRFADSQLALGRNEEAKTAISNASKTSERLLERDAQNAEWKLNASRVNIAAAFIKKHNTLHEESELHIHQAITLAKDVLHTDPTHLNAKLAYVEALALRVGESTTASDANELRQALETVNNDPDSRVFSAMLKGNIALANYYDANSEGNQAGKLRHAALNQAESYFEQLSTNSQLWVLKLYCDAGEHAKAKSILTKFESMHLRHPLVLEATRKLKQIKTIP